MTRQKKILFIVLFVFISLFTLIVIFSRLGSISTENDPALDPMNNPNIRIQWDQFKKRNLNLFIYLLIYFQLGLN